MTEMVHTRLLSILILALPIAAGLLFMQLSGAPSSFIAKNTGAFLASAVLLLLVRFPISFTVQSILIVTGLSLLAATLVMGVPADGMKRWLSLGPLRLHMGMLLLPMIGVWAAKAKAPFATAAFAICAAIIAMQPDRAVALALFLCSIAIVMLRRDLWALAMATFAAIALAVTMLRGDPLVGVEFTEHVIRDGFAWHPAMGAVLASAMAIATGFPLVKGREGGPLCAVMTGFFAASLLGPYPTPLSGFGASPIIGYALGLGLFMRSNGNQKIA